MREALQPCILVVDDEAPARRRLFDVLDDCRASFPFVLVGEAANGIEAMRIMSETAVDIVLLDIRMPEMDGVEVAHHVQKMPAPPAIIFTTAYDAYAIKAFELNAVDYLLKPVRRDRLAIALTKAQAGRRLSGETLKALSPRQRTHLSIIERDKVLLVPVAEVRYMRAELKYVTLKTSKREYLLEESLVSLEEEFGACFTRIHRNCLVANSAVAGFERVTPKDAEPYWVVILNDLGEKLPVSRRQQHLMKRF